MSMLNRMKESKKLTAAARKLSQGVRAGIRRLSAGLARDHAALMVALAGRIRAHRAFLVRQFGPDLALGV